MPNALTSPYAAQRSRLLRLWTVRDSVLFGLSTLLLLAGLAAAILDAPTVATGSLDCRNRCRVGALDGIAGAAAPAPAERGRDRVAGPGRCPARSVRRSRVR